MGPNGGEYHYHVNPSCLLAQSGDHELIDTIDSHSPIIGWAFDGFPIYGPHGVDGSEIYSCEHSDANGDDCVDSCNGHAQHQIDDFLYHYHILGPIGDLTWEPVNPLPSSAMYPYTLGCLRGVPSDWTVLSGAQSAGTAECVSNGTAEGFVPEPLEGVTNVYGGATTESPNNGTAADDSDDSTSSSYANMASVSVHILL